MLTTLTTSRTKSLALGVLTGLALLAGGFLAGDVTRGWLGPRIDNLSLLKEAHQLLVSHFFGELPDDLAMQRGMIRGMVAQTGDPFTTYVEPVPHELQADALSGEYGGIGAYLSLDSEGRVRLVPFEDGPAARAGIIEGDTLLAVDGARVDEQSDLNQITALIRGPVGSNVELTLAARSPGASPIKVVVQREAILLPSVASFLTPEEAEVGVIKISSFSERTPQEVEEAYMDLVARGALSLVLDLRGNTGGLLDSSVDVARLFLPAGLIALEDRGTNEREAYTVEKRGPAADMPLAVLVDGGTASGGEVVAAALQSNLRAPLIGSSTFGKGSVQAVLNLSDGSSLHVTIARWLTPDGNLLDGRGLVPDILVEQGSGEADSGLRMAIEWLANHGEQAP